MLDSFNILLTSESVNENCSYVNCLLFKGIKVCETIEMTE
jgi:hypothetical protein